MKCKLCDNEATLEESHIIPKFVYKWIKQTSIRTYAVAVNNCI